LPASHSFIAQARSWFVRGGWEANLGSGETRPRVVAVNGRGERRVLFTQDSWDDAVAARDRVQDDLLRMGIEAWRDFYRVPSDFLL
jgi:hypothetical protein